MATTEKTPSLGMAILGLGISLAVVFTVAYVAGKGWKKA